jgi:hypothetical protein
MADFHNMTIVSPWPHHKLGLHFHFRLILTGRFVRRDVAQVNNQLLVEKSTDMQQATQN